VSVKQSITPFWDTRIGADMTVARQGTLTTSELLSEKLANGGSLPQSSGTAWAAISAPGVASIWDKTSVEARVDPGQEQSRLGTTLSKSLPLNEQYSLTLQNGYNLIQQGIVPVPGIISHPARSYEADQSAKLSPTPGPVSSPGRPCRPRTTNGCARSAPNRSCSTASPSPARSAKRPPAPPARVSARGSSVAGRPESPRFGAFSGPDARTPENDRALPQIGPDAVKIRSTDGTASLRRAGDVRARLKRNKGIADERDHSFRRN
jgi:hypothetical protein